MSTGDNANTQNCPNCKIPNRHLMALLLCCRINAFTGPIFFDKSWWEQKLVSTVKVHSDAIVATAWFKSKNNAIYNVNCATMRSIYLLEAWLCSQDISLLKTELPIITILRPCVNFCMSLRSKICQDLINIVFLWKSCRWQTVWHLNTSVLCIRMTV